MYAHLFGTCALSAGRIPTNSIQLRWGEVCGEVRAAEGYQREKCLRLLKLGLVFMETELRMADWYSRLDVHVDDEQMLMALVDTDGRECATIIVDNTDEALQRIEDRLARKIERFDIELPS